MGLTLLRLMMESSSCVVCDRLVRARSHSLIVNALCCDLCSSVTHRMCSSGKSSYKILDDYQGSVYLCRNKKNPQIHLLFWLLSLIEFLFYLRLRFLILKYYMVLPYLNYTPFLRKRSIERFQFVQYRRI